MQAFGTRRAQLSRTIRASGGPVALKKGTISNLFRYTAQKKPVSGIRLDGFDRVLGVDVAGRRLDVEGLVTHETIVDATLPRGLLPTVTPELKHITLGGAAVSSLISLWIRLTSKAVHGQRYRYGRQCRPPCTLSNPTPSISI